MDETKNELPKGIGTRQLIKYAKGNGYNSVKFTMNQAGKHLCTGSFLDAYYEFVQIPVVEKGFVRLSDLEEMYDYNVSFDVIDDEDFITDVRLDFILRGREIPKEYMFREEEE